MTEQVEGIVYSVSRGMSINCTAEFLVDDDVVGELVFAYDDEGNDVTDEIDAESIGELAAKLENMLKGE